MKYNLDQAINILNRTPKTFSTLMKGQTSEWTHTNEGGDSWSPHVIIAHLIFGEDTDWMPRVKVFLSDDHNVSFTPFDMKGHAALAHTMTTDELLDMLEKKRNQSLAELRVLNLQETDLDRTAAHPELGIVALRNHLSAWVAHDLGHIAQVSRVMAKQLRGELGPWSKFMTVLHDRPQN